MFTVFQSTSHLFGEFRVFGVLDYDISVHWWENKERVLVLRTHRLREAGIESRS